MNNVKFEVGDIVCLKKNYLSPMGGVYCSPFSTYPMRVIRIYEDKDAEDRIGEIGCANQYFLESLIHLNENETTIKNIKHYQYELCYWVERREEVLEIIENYFLALGKVGEGINDML